MRPSEFSQGGQSLWSFESHQITDVTALGLVS